MDDKSTPFIRLIKTPLSYYFYDVNTNQFVEIPEETYHYLDSPDGAIPSDKTRRLIADLKQKGYLSAFRPQKMRHQNTDELEYLLSHSLQQVTLQLTQQCNFRCSYCIYGPKDFDTQRTHSPKTMRLETALQAIDFFAQRSDNWDLPGVGFYGGEPLLEFDLLKEVVLYAEKLFDGRDLLFTITTNASLLNLEKVAFLQEHDFGILVSIDGTPEINDRGRKYAATGWGTYEIIEQRLRAVYDDFPDYYQNKISFNIVVDQRFSTEAIHNFFANHELFKNNRVQTSYIDDGSINFEKHSFYESCMISENKYAFYALLNHMGRLRGGDYLKIANESLDSQLDKFKVSFLASKGLEEELSHGGPCTPGGRRLFVDVDGNLFPCERVSETSPAMLLGNLQDGFDFEKCEALLNICALTQEECKNCWALRHCTQCAKQCDNNGVLSAELKKSCCDRALRSAQQSFRLFLALRELNKKAAKEVVS